LQLHPYCQQRPIVAYCEKRGIVIQAYSPLLQAKVRPVDTVQRIADSKVRSGKKIASGAPSHERRRLPADDMILLGFPIPSGGRSIQNIDPMVSPERVSLSAFHSSCSRQWRERIRIFFLDSRSALFYSSLTNYSGHQTDTYRSPSLRAPRRLQQMQMCMDSSFPRRK
jgi:hypothetical protein